MLGVLRTHGPLAGSRVVSLKLCDSRGPWYHDPVPQPSVALTLVSANSTFSGEMAFEWGLRVKQAFCKQGMREAHFRLKEC